MFSQRPPINEVFTPRRPELNTKIYVNRPDHEKELVRALEGSLHPILCGYSGSGKSWLYKKVLKDIDATAAIANCANACRFKSITTEILNRIIPEELVLQAISEEKSAGVDAVFADASLKSTKNYVHKSIDPLLKCFKTLRQKANKSTAVIVLDNIETITKSSDLLNELSNIIILCDDAMYAEFKIKILIVGAPNNVIDFFSKIDNVSTVVNRLHELKEIKGLSLEQVRALISNGFIKLLKIDISEELFNKWVNHINNITLGIAQHVHEYCEHLAHLVKDNNWRASESHLGIADISFIRMSFKSFYAKVECLLEHEKQQIDARLLYTIGHFNTISFSMLEVENKIRRIFPRFNRENVFPIEQTLLRYCEAKEPIIKKINQNNFEFIDPRFIVCLRLMFKKDLVTESIYKSNFNLHE